MTPIRPAELVLGKTLPFALFGFFNVALITAVAGFWFAVAIRGSLPLSFGATALYLLSTLGIGLFISTVSKTQQEALKSTFFFDLPAVLLSGFVIVTLAVQRARKGSTCQVTLAHDGKSKAGRPL